MKKQLITIISVLFIAVLSSCEKDYTELYSDNKPEIPVTYVETTTHGFNPYLIVPVSQDNFTLTLTIPESSGRQISEITSVLAGSTSINAGGVRSATYISSPIAGQGNRAVFNTSISEFRESSPGNNTLVGDFLNSATATELQIAFMFLVTLDDETEIIPVQAQIWLRK